MRVYSHNVLFMCLNFVILLLVSVLKAYKSLCYYVIVIHVSIITILFLHFDAYIPCQANLQWQFNRSISCILS